MNEWLVGKRVTDPPNSDTFPLPPFPGNLTVEVCLC